MGRASRLAPSSEPECGGGTFMAHRVLVVDGEVEGLARIQAHLQPQGYAFTWALSAEEALETVQNEAPDVIVVDAGLADQSAIELVTSLRKGNPPQHVPI